MTVTVFMNFFTNFTIILLDCHYGKFNIVKCLNNWGTIFVLLYKFSSLFKMRNYNPGVSTESIKSYTFVPYWHSSSKKYWNIFDVYIKSWPYCLVSTFLAQFDIKCLLARKLLQLFVPFCCQELIIYSLGGTNVLK